MAARVLLQHLQQHPFDDETANSINFLVTLLHAVVKTNSTANIYLSQLLNDIEVAGVKTVGGVEVDTKESRVC